MQVTIFYNKYISQLVNATDRHKSFVKREGCKPSNLSGVLCFTIEGKINLSWKRTFERHLTMIKGYSIQRIICGEHSLDMATNNSKAVSNAVANYLIRIKKPIRLDNITESFLLK